ncbi:MAG: hypothetical protein JNM49_10680 [Flavobacteriales bacterium]|nr:hypothetical protein [Flavobacteriales bacterium]
MRTEADRWLGALFHGWVELLTLLSMLVVALFLMGWAWNRGVRPSDRRAWVSAPQLIAGFALILLLRATGNEIAAAGIIASGLLAAGLLSRSIQPIGLWLPTVAFSALLGIGFNLSALVLLLVTVLALLFSAGRQR